MPIEPQILSAWMGVPIKYNRRFCLDSNKVQHVWFAYVDDVVVASEFYSQNEDVPFDEFDRRVRAVQAGIDKHLKRENLDA